MSEKQNLSKSQRKKIRKADKRKASCSPEVDSGGHLSTTSTPYTDRHNSVNTVNTQDFAESERYVNTVLSFNTSPIMNNNQPNSMYGMSTPQQQLHYQHQGQSPAVFSPATNPTQMPPPPWAISLIEDVKVIKSAIPKIDEIESSIKIITHKITTLNDKVANVETKVNDMENSLSFISNEQDNHRAAINKSKEELNTLQNKCKHLEETILLCKQKEESTTDKLLDLESRSMRENLMFYGIPETTPQPGQPFENCEKLVKDLIATKLQIDNSDIQIDRAHRIGGERAKKPRPIVVKFHDYTQRESVRRKSLDDTTKASLRGANMGIGIQTPQQYREARKAFMDQSKREEQLGNKARVIGTKLYVNNRPVKKYVDGKVVDV